MFGVHTALVTPFTSKDSLDIDAYERLAARQLQAGVQGLVACGTTGETPTLSLSEWEQCIRAAVRVAGTSASVTAGVGTNCTRTTIQHIERAQKLGAQAGLLVLPYYNKPNPQGLLAHVTQSAQVGLPLVVYHVPSRTGQRLPASQLAELAGLPGVVAVKEASGDVRLGASVCAATDTPVLSGDDHTFLPLLSVGGKGVISVISNIAPAQVLAVVQAFQDGNHQAAIAGFQALLPLIRFCFSDTNPIPCKAVLAALGLCEARVRLPLGPYQGTVPTALLQQVAS